MQQGTVGYVLDLADTSALCLSIFTVSFMDIGQMMPLAIPSERQDGLMAG